MINFVVVFALGYSLVILITMSRKYRQLMDNFQASKENTTFWKNEALRRKSLLEKANQRADKWYKVAHSYKDIADKLVQNNLAKVSAFVNEVYEGTVIENHVLKADDNGNIHIYIGADDQFVDVDMDFFKEDSHGALELAKQKWIETYVNSSEDSNEEEE